MLSSASARPDESPLVFALVVLRVVSSSLAVIITGGALALFYLNKSFKRLTKDAYRGISTPAEQPGTPPEGPAQEITPVVVKQLSLRQSL